MLTAAHAWSRGSLGQDSPALVHEPGSEVICSCAVSNIHYRILKVPPTRNLLVAMASKKGNGTGPESFCNDDNMSLSSSTATYTEVRSENRHIVGKF